MDRLQEAREQSVQDQLTTALPQQEWMSWTLYFSCPDVAKAKLPKTDCQNQRRRCHADPGTSSSRQSLPLNRMTLSSPANPKPESLNHILQYYSGFHVLLHYPYSNPNISLYRTPETRKPQTQINLAAYTSRAV